MCVNELSAHISQEFEEEEEGGTDRRRACSQDVSILLMARGRAVPQPYLAWRADGNQKRPLIFQALPPLSPPGGTMLVGS